MMQISMAARLKSTPPINASRWTAVCGNRECRTGWLQLLRKRSFPRFEEKWACSAACMEQILADAVCSQIECWEPVQAERALRMPLGLILLSRGWITQRELQEALAAQRRAGNGRIGEWLGRLHGISEETIAKALAIQWNCAVLPHGMPDLELAPLLMPAFLRKCYGLALLRQGPDATLYLAGRHRAEHAAARAMEYMLREPVHAAFLEDGAWSFEQAEITDTTELLIPGPNGVVATIAELIERIRPSDARLVRLHNHLWLRIWLASRVNRPPEIREIVLSLTGREGQRRDRRAELDAAKNAGSEPSRNGPLHASGNRQESW